VQEAAEKSFMRGVTPATVFAPLEDSERAGLIACRREGQFIYNQTVPETIRGYTRALTKISKRKKQRRRIDVEI